MKKFFAAFVAAASAPFAAMAALFAEMSFAMEFKAAEVKAMA